MKIFKIFLGGVLYLALSASSMAAAQSVTDIISGLLSGGDKVASFSINYETKEINYTLKKQVKQS